MGLHNCKWVGDEFSCCLEPVFKKSYCEKHYARVYVELTPEMADYIIEKETKDGNSRNEQNV